MYAKIFTIRSQKSKLNFQNEKHEIKEGFVKSPILQLLPDLHLRSKSISPLRKIM